MWSARSSTARWYDAALLQAVAEHSADEASAGDQHQREEDAKQVDAVPADQADDQKHRLCSEVGARGGDHGVAERCADTLYPGGTTGSDDETEQCAEEEECVETVAVGVDDSCDDREWNGEDECDRGSCTKRIPIPTAVFHSRIVPTPSRLDRF